MMNRIEDRLNLLNCGLRDRQWQLQSLRDAVVWSHDLLPEVEQPPYRRLCGFRHRFTIEAADAVLDPVTPFLGTLESIVDWSLVQYEVGAITSEARYRIDETIRDFGIEQLVEADEAQCVDEGIASWSTALAEAMSADLRDADQHVGLARLASEARHFQSRWGGYLEIGRICQCPNATSRTHSLPSETSRGHGTYSRKSEPVSVEA